MRLSNALRTGWPEYLMEAAGLGLFMLSACSFAVLLEHPSSPVRQAIAGDLPRRALMGLAMGLTALLLIRSPWGQQSGAHYNPAVTLTFFTLGKVPSTRAAFYVLAQFAGGVAGVSVASLLVGNWLEPLHYVATEPGPSGVPIAFLAEFLISALLMTTVLRASNSATYSSWTPYFAAALVASFITFEAPYSGMSMNPARTFASAVASHRWTAFYLYLIAPSAGMLFAAGLHYLTHQRTYCAKLHHQNHKRCLFRCNYGELHGKSLHL